MARDGKGGFYKKLQLDKSTKKIIRAFRSLKKTMMADTRTDRQ